MITGTYDLTVAPAAATLVPLSDAAERTGCCRAHDLFARASRALGEVSCSRRWDSGTVILQDDAESFSGGRISDDQRA